MLKIDNKLLEEEKIEINWGQHTCTTEGIFNETVIIFSIEGINGQKDKIGLEVETTFSVKRLEQMHIDEEIDIKRYVTDTVYSVNGVCLDISYNIRNKIFVHLKKITETEFIIKIDINIIQFEYSGKFSILKKQ